MWLSVVGFIVAILVVIVGVSKQYNFVLMSLIGSLVIALTSQMDTIGAIIGSENSFLAGMGGFITDYFLIFLLSSIFAKYMEESGAAESIANFILQIIGQDDPYFVLVAVFVIGAILTYGGISVFVALFVVIPLARNLFRRLDIPWYLLATPYFMGIGTFTMTTLPGSPQIQNVIPSQALDTPLTAAPFISMAAALVAIVWALWRIRVELKAALERGDTFELEEAGELVESRDTPLPGTFISLLPLLSLILVIFIGSYREIDNIIYYGLGLAVILSLILFHKYIPSHRAVLNPGVENSISPVILPAAAVGFGNVMASSEAFAAIIDGAQTLPIPNVLTVSLLTIFLVFSLGSASGALGLVTEAVIPLYNLTGTSPQVVHRMIAISSGLYAPHNNALLTFYSVSGLDHQAVYRNFNISVNGGMFLQLATFYLLSQLFS